MTKIGTVIQIILKGIFNLDQPILLFPPYTFIEYCQEVPPYTFLFSPYTFIAMCQKFPSYTIIWFIPFLYFY